MACPFQDRLRPWMAEAELPWTARLRVLEGARHSRGSVGPGQAGPGQAGPGQAGPEKPAEQNGETTKSGPCLGDAQDE